MQTPKIPDVELHLLDQPGLPCGPRAQGSEAWGRGRAQRGPTHSAPERPTSRLPRALSRVHAEPGSRRDSLTPPLSPWVQHRHRRDGNAPELLSSSAGSTCQIWLVKCPAVQVSSHDGHTCELRLTRPRGTPSPRIISGVKNSSERLDNSQIFMSSKANVTAVSLRVRLCLAFSWTWLSSSFQKKTVPHSSQRRSLLKCLVAPSKGHPETQTPERPCI